MSSSNFYDVLGTEADASPEDIRKAYKKKALQTHPDRLPQGATAGEKKAAEEQFRRVNNAYEILIDPKNRKLYDMYGVWPPPEDFPEDASRQRGTYNGYPSSPRPFPFSGPFSDPFNASLFNSSPFGDPLSRHRPRPGFAFRDPFELFNAIFADMQRDFYNGPAGMFRSPLFDPFSHGPSSMFDRSQPRPLAPFPSLFDQSAFPDADHWGGSSRPNGTHTFSFQSSSRGHFAPSDDGQTPRWVSESRTVRTVNGETQSVHKRTDSLGNKYVTKIYPDGREKHTVNGVEQSSPPRHIRDAPHEQSRHDTDPDFAPVIPPEPEAGTSRKRRWVRH